MVGDDDAVIATLSDGQFFGEMGLLLSVPRIASVRATTDCDLFMLAQGDFRKMLRDRPQFATSIGTIARERYHVTLGMDCDRPDSRSLCASRSRSTPHHG